MPEDIARIVFEENAWLRAPSAAIERSTPIVTAIRLHTKRCERDDRKNLFGKVQLHGSVGESALESALLPGAFESAPRPRGHVYYLATVGPRKWKNPFDGLDLAFLTAKKPTQPKKKQPSAKPAAAPRHSAASSVKKANSTKGSATPPPRSATPSSAVAPPKNIERKITLRIPQNGAAVKTDADGDDEREITALPPRPRAPSRTFSASSRATITLPGLKKTASKQSRRMDGLISSDESGSSDSEVEMAPVQSRPRGRKPPPLPLHAASPFLNQYSPRHSDHYLPSPGLPQSPMFGAPTPCPSHSLDNTTWTVRRDQDANAQFETSSSSSDDELRSDWGMASGVLLENGNGEDSFIWSPVEDESSIKEATDALRVLFPMRSPEEERDRDPMREPHLDTFPSASDTGSVAESTSTTTVHPHPKSRMGMKARECAAVPLTTWNGNSSPIASPSFRPATLPIDVSPTQHLSRLRDSFEPSEMDGMDIDNPVWVDETGEGPVKSPDDSFEDHLSSAGETTLEQEKQNDLFAWACEAAASRNQMHVKQEPEDYPSPLTTDDGSGGYTHESRASSAALETRSSSSSELELPELESMDGSRFDLQELLIGPESVTIDELEGWLPPNKEKTPRRKGKRDIGLSLANFDFGNGPIGVGNRQALLAFKGGPKLVRKRSSRSRRGGAATTSPTHATRSQLVDLAAFNATSPSELTDLDSDPADTDIDMIGTEELEHARAEAEAKEETSRKLAQERANRQRACLEACRALRPGSTSTCETMPPTPWLDHASPFDFANGWGHGSTESLSVCTPTPSVLSPVMLQSVAGLSIADTVSGPKFGVDPKHLVSPTFHPHMFGPPVPPFPAPPPMADHAIFNLEELVSQAEAAAGLAPPVVNNAKSSSIPTVPVPIAGNVPAPAQSQPQPQPLATVPECKLAAAEKKQKSKAEPPIPVATTTPAQSLPTVETKALLATPPPPPSLAPVVTTASTSAASSSANSPAPSTKSAGKPTLSNALYTPGDEGQYHGMVSILKHVCPGVLATVVDNIPVYVHVAGPIEPFGKVDVFRRLDSDFGTSSLSEQTLGAKLILAVNVTTLLIALGIPIAQHAKYINQADWDTKTHVTMAPSVQGHNYAPGVAGTWTRLSQAQELARQLGVEICDDTAGGIGNVLRDDLFQVFATMANLNPKHSPSDNFGCSTFLPEPLQDKAKKGAAAGAGAGADANNGSEPKSATALSTPTPVSASTSSSLASSSVNSKSTPNLTALSASAPSGPGLRKPQPTTATAKASLVRPTPSTPLDPGPQPKRRRATIVDGVAPKMSPIAAAAAPAPAASGSASQSPPTSSASTVPRILPAPAPAPATRRPPPKTGSAQAQQAAVAPMQKRATRASLGNIPSANTNPKAIK